MNSLLLIAALGIGAMLYINNSNRELLEDVEEKNEELYDEIQQQIQDGIVSPETVATGIDYDIAMIGLSSISDKYWNCAAGVVWKNTTAEAINIKVDSAVFSIGGYEMRVGAKDLTTITVPAKGEVYQALFAYENKTLFATKAERDAVRVVIGTAQGHPGKQGRDVWGKADFETQFACTYSTVGTISKVRGTQSAISNKEAVGRYYGSTALKGRLASWVRNYIG
jgi:hypothetical protein